ncbi:MAG TPA: right-handed parallel beta-helix repeat-containing protein [Stackebrandtia sp.]|jgi:hypothetical protein|uniref:right-handed parallel beta-helix repeat-containing protein n=1 Tax=Stackebrandtia sp. TaxID=2023065 RepID=UPI002D3F226F|nr:right-handed parallel beta-helix repeat-containing protein [Stackebrandtia sp.]HZE40071.1 right-handed parallel beta-helix repeat-containing protein [Stackebrandtia sp.]
MRNRTRVTTIVGLAAAFVVAVGGPLVSANADSYGERLVITEGGTPDHPKVFHGNGEHVDGITVEADNVVVDGYVADHPEAPGVEITGSNITVQNVTISEPHGGDGDGIRFFGDHLKILDNTVDKTSNDNGHADCMQTFADDTPASHDVLIEGNHCKQIDNMCVMAEGPNDGEGDGNGHTYNVTIRKNFCETLEASQNLMFEDVQNATISDNQFTGNTDHAIGLAIGSTGARVSGNTLDDGIECEVGIDESSREGYQGPEPECEP